MRITRDTLTESNVFDSIRTNWKNLEPRTKTHVSDLAWPRQSYWARVAPKPATDQEIMYWLTGLGHELVFRHASGYRSEQTEFCWEGIWYAPDFYQSMDGGEPYPVDLKTRRGYLAKPGDEAKVYHGYIYNTILPYCAIMSKNRGWLHIWCLSERNPDSDFGTVPIMHCFLVEFTDDELEGERNRLRAARDLFERALDTRDHLILPLCEEWACGKNHRTTIKKPECGTCGAVYSTTDWLNKHLDKNPGHVGIPPVFDWKFTARCKWFRECRGEEFEKRGITVHYKEEPEAPEGKEDTGGQAER